MMNYTLLSVAFMETWQVYILREIYDDEDYFHINGRYDA